MTAAEGLTVAVTGPTGTFGFGLIPLLEADDRIGRIVGVARRPFDPADHGWSKLEYRRGDVRDIAVLEDAFAGADVVVHLAFLIAGARKDPATRAINVDGTLNTFRAAAAAGAKRFVYASSVSAYGFAPDAPGPITEDRSVRPADNLFYAQEKAELEGELAALAAHHPELDVYLLRPPGVLGPNMIGGKSERAARVVPHAQRAIRRLRRSRVPVPLPLPEVQLQLIHETDVGTAFLQCIVGAGPAGAYNIAGDGVVDGADIARALGFRPVIIRGPRVPGAMRRLADLSKRRFGPEALSWAEALAAPVIMDTTKAREQLGWKPRWTSQQVLDEAVTGEGVERTP
ncbi:MAG: NAD-dependent epimerase/dehydratase family protein [Actinomycetota bacterium]|nr:NAD-dependent epimerase/dehydratase family protein [Actinomycetota bacterium]